MSNESEREEHVIRNLGFTRELSALFFMHETQVYYNGELPDCGLTDEEQSALRDFAYSLADDPDFTSHDIIRRMAKSLVKAKDESEPVINPS